MPLLLTLTYFKPCSSISIVNFEHVIAGWEETIPLNIFLFKLAIEALEKCVNYVQGLQ